MKTKNVIQGYQIKQEIGTGSFSVVHKAIQLSTQKLVAMKIMKNLPQNDEKSVQNEISLMNRLDHPNIIKCVDSFKSRQKLYIALQFCGKGDLEKFSKKQGPIPEQFAKNVIYKIVNALEHLHDNKIVHRDLKLANILIDEEYDVKLADFGFSKDYQAGMMTSMCGTPLTMAPQVLQHQQYNQKCDTWSLGVISYILLCGEYPFKPKNTAGNRMEELKNIIIKGKGPAFPQKLGLTAEAKQFLLSCLTLNVKSRPSMKDLLDHQWFLNPLLSHIRVDYLKNSLGGISEVVQKTQVAIQSYLKKHITNMIKKSHIIEKQVNQTLKALGQLYPSNFQIQFIYLLSITEKNSQLQSKPIKVRIGQRQLSINSEQLKPLQNHCKQMTQFLSMKANEMKKKLELDAKNFVSFEKSLIQFICQQAYTYVNSIQSIKSTIKLLLNLAQQLSSTFQQTSISIQYSMKEDFSKNIKQFHKYANQTIDEDKLVKLVNEEYQHVEIDYHEDEMRNDWLVQSTFTDKNSDQSHWTVLDIVKRTLKVTFEMQQDQNTQQFTGSA